MKHIIFLPSVFLFIVTTVLVSAETVEQNGYVLQQYVSPVNTQVVGNGYISTVQSSTSLGTSESLQGNNGYGVVSQIRTPVTIDTAIQNNASISFSSGGKYVVEYVKEITQQAFDNAIESPVANAVIAPIYKEYNKLGGSKKIIHTTKKIKETIVGIERLKSSLSHDYLYIINVLDSKISFGLVSLLAVIMLIIAFGVSVLGYGAVPTMLSIFILLFSFVGAIQNSLVYLFPLLLSLYSLAVLGRSSKSEQLSLFEILLTDVSVQ